MRTLKKTLCMVLVLAMMVGLCAIGASAVTIDDYKDKDAIEHKEAVAVLSAINVLQGDDKGTFRPTDPLTRAESAAFFTRLCASTGAGTSTFTDMGAYAWAQPYVAYCQAAGIVAGNGDGTFNPGGNTSTVAWAKMCLCALGYDPVREGLVGDQWEINTIRLVNKIDLAKNIANPAWNDSITRDDAAQFGFNTLTKTMQEYVGGSDIHVSTGDGTNVDVTGYVPATDVANTSYDYRGQAYVSTHSTMQFCENYFPTLKMALNQKDQFKMPKNVWFQGDNRKDGVLTKAKTIVSVDGGRLMATYDKNTLVTEKQIYADGKLTADAHTLTVYTNGDQTSWTVANSADSYPMLNYGGATLYLYDTSDEGSSDYGIADTAIFKVPFLAKVSTVNAATPSKDRNIALTVYADKNGDGTRETYSMTYETEGFARNDYVLVYPNCQATAIADNKTVLDVVKPESANGTLTKYSVKGTSVSALTVGDISYSVGSKYLAALGTEDTKTVGSSDYSGALRFGQTVYLSNGFVLGIVGDSVAYSDYVFLRGSAASGSILNPAQKTAFVKQDGTAVEALTSNVGTSVPAADTVNYWGTAVEGSNGAYKITVDKSQTVKVTTGDTDTIKASNPKLAGSIIADAKTAFIIFNGVTYKTFTGIGNLPTYTGKMDIYALVPSSGAHAAAIYIKLDGAKAVNPDTKLLFLTNAQAVTGTGVEGLNTVNSFTAIVDGELKNIKSTSNKINTSHTAGLYVPVYDGDGYLLAEPNTTFATTTQNVYVNNELVSKVAISGGVITVGSNSYAVASGAQAYIFNSTYGTLTVKDAADINNMENVKLTLEPVSGADGTIKAIYVVQ